MSGVTRILRSLIVSLFYILFGNSIVVPGIFFDVNVSLIRALFMYYDKLTQVHWFIARPQKRALRVPLPSLCPSQLRSAHGGTEEGFGWHRTRYALLLIILSSRCLTSTFCSRQEVQHCRQEGVTHGIIIVISTRIKGRPVRPR